MMHWHKDHIGTIAILLKAHETASQIGRRFGVSRNAVIGVVHRNEELKRIGFARSLGPMKGRQAGGPKRQRIPRAPRITTPFDVSVPLPEIPIRASEPHVAGITLMMLVAGMCKFPINDVPRGGTFLFCGTPTEHGPYCSHHVPAPLKTGRGEDSMARWYAVRTMPGFQSPHRERWPEPNPVRGYTIISTLDHSRSKIEANLDEAGFAFYMPAEYIAVRNRKKAGLYELRRFALLKGYVFVELADGDWLRLYDVPGVAGVVENCSQPFAISALDLFRLRMYEQNNRAVAVAKAHSLSKAGERLEREKRKGIIKGAKKKLFPGRQVRLAWGDKIGREATVQAWEDQDKVKVLLDSLESSETITVPFEYLKAAS